MKVGKAGTARRAEAAWAVYSMHPCPGIEWRIEPYELTRCRIHFTAAADGTVGSKHNGIAHGENAKAATLISISAGITLAATKSMVSRPLAWSGIVPRAAERARVKIHYVRKIGIHDDLHRCHQIQLVHAGSNRRPSYAPP